MTTPANTTILISGANGGIGRGLADAYLARPHHTVVALVRDTANETSQSLLSQPAGSGSRVVLISYDTSKVSAAESATEELSDHHLQITGIDLIIANAGVAAHFGPSLDVDPSVYLEHFTVNALEPLTLFKAAFPLLQKSAKPTFIAITSGGGSTTATLSKALTFDATGKPRPGSLPYTASKSASNHMMARLSVEHADNMRFGLFTPGPTKTGLGGPSFDWSIVPNISPMEKVVDGLIKQFDELMVGGQEQVLKLKNFDGRVFPW